MRSYIFFAILVFAVSLAVGCGGDAPTNVTNTNTVGQNTNSAAPPANAVLDPIRKPPAATSNLAPTVAPVVHAYYDGLKNKDAAAVRNVMARDFLQMIDTDMKDENETDLVAFLTKYDKLPENKMEVRNELIAGNRATAEIRGGAYGDWTTVVFRNEGGAWKMSNEVSK